LKIKFTFLQDKEGLVSTVDIIEPTSFDQVIFILNYLLFYKTSYKEVSHTEPSPSVIVPAYSHLLAQHSYSLLLFDETAGCQNVAAPSMIHLIHVHLT
jgi:hypothetical protein